MFGRDEKIHIAAGLEVETMVPSPRTASILDESKYPRYQKDFSCSFCAAQHWHQERNGRLPFIGLPAS